MGQLTVVSIKDFRDVESVVQPVHKLSEVNDSPTLNDIFNHLQVRFQHERFCANTSHELVDHI